METVKVVLQQDHLERICRSTQPIHSIAELIWNGFDAGATRVDVEFVKDGAENIQDIIIRDNGNGVSYKQAKESFSNLGNSWKKKRRSAFGRNLHGKQGKGRFKAFSLGTIAKWTTRYKDENTMQTFSITGDHESLGTFVFSDQKPVHGVSTGTVVEISNIARALPSLEREKAELDLCQMFALYLMQYPDAQLHYGESQVDPKSLIERQTSIPFNVSVSECSDTNDDVIACEIIIIEWKVNIERKLFLCDEDGFIYDDIPPGIQAPNFHFTVFAKSEYFKKIHDDQLLAIEMPTKTKIIEESKDHLREYFAKRRAEQATKLVEQWKKEDIYPFKDEPKDVVDKAERQVFDIVAMNLTEHAKHFDESDVKSKQITFGLLKNALETNPTLLRKFLGDVLELSEAKQKELAELLNQTSLDSIISASRTITNRLDFLRGLEVILFDEKSRKTLTERKQLHRILAAETWIFGEEYNLIADDENLLDVLIKYTSKLNVTEDKIDYFTPVIREDGREGIVDLVLAGTIPQSNNQDHVNLVIELKRPMQPINSEICGQIESYALAVSKDERFPKENTKWVFIAVSNKLTEEAKDKSSQGNRQKGILYQSEDGRIVVWVMEWNHIINACKARMAFFREKLNYAASRENALKYLSDKYNEYLPSCVKEEAEKNQTIDE